MSDTNREKILKINTQGAEKNVKSLKTQIRELKEQLAGLDKNTAEYDRVSKQLADTNQKQIEINEAMKYSNQDLGATLSNLTKVSAGVIGAISSINSVMVLMGADSEEAQEAMKKIQALMAIIQGMSAIDTAAKALKGLTVAFQGFNTVKGTNAAVTAGAATAEVAEAGALADNTKEMIKNNKEGKRFNELNKDAADYSSQSAVAIAAEKEAMKGNTEAVKDLIAELENLKAAQAAEKASGMKTTSDVLTKELTERKAAAEALLATVGKDGGKMADRLQREIGRYDSLLASLNDNTLDATEAISLAWRTLSSELEHNIKFNLPVDDVKDTMKAMVAAMSPEQIEQQINRLTELMQEPVKYFGKDGDIEAKSAELTRIRNENYTQQIAILEARKAELAAQAVQEKNLEGQIKKTTNAENAETGAIIANSKAKKENAGATTTMGNAEAVANKKLAGTEPVLTKLGSSIKNAAKSIVSFVKANPILLGIAAAIAAIAVVITQYTKAMKEANKERKLTADINAQVKNSYEEEIIRLRTLIKTAADENEGLEERKKAVEELNKLVPEYNAKIDETTGKYTANRNALKEYCEKLREKMLLEAYEGKIKEYLQEQLELQLKINKVANSGWNLFGWRIDKAKSKIKDLDKDIDFMWKKIKELDLSKALDENKNNNNGGGVGGIKKTFTELFNDLKSLWKEFYSQITQSKEIDRISDGVYTKAQLAFDKLMEYINGNLIADKLSDQFKKALKNGFAGLDSIDITPNFVFSEEYIKELQDRIQKQKDELKEMLKQENVSEKLLEKQRNRVKSTQAELDNIFNITKQTKEVLNLNKELNKAFSNRNKSNKQYMQQQSIEQEYYQKMKRNYGKKYQYDELFKEIELQKLSNKYAEERKAEYEKELDLMTQRQIKNREEYEELLAKGKLSDKEIEKFKEKQKLEEKDFEYLKKNGKFTDEEIKKFKENQTEKAHLLDEELEKRKKIDEENKKINEGNVAINTANWKIRLQKLDEEYDKIKGISELEQHRLELQRTLKGGGVVDYNLDLDIINSQIKAIEKQRDYINQFYADRQDRYATDSAEWQSLENERRAAIDAINREWDEKDLERERVQMERKLNIQKTYINLYSTISGQISNILSAEMDMYDSNTEEYKKLKYRQGVISTAEGVLGAFMSGIESGVPAPWNLAVALAMATTTLTAGIMQLNNIKNEKVGGTMPTTTDLSSREYDTLSYQTNVDTLGAIQDQRVIVVESDITDTQRRVEVAETQAVF